MRVPTEESFNVARFYGGEKKNLALIKKSVLIYPITIVRHLCHRRPSMMTGYSQ
jgi:hypothetical protein